MKPTRSPLVIAATNSLGLERPVEVDSYSMLRTARLVLRPLRASDHDEFIRVIAASRSHLDEWMPLHEPDESDDDLFARQLRLTEDGDKGRSAWRRIGILDDGRIAGAFNLTRIDRGLTAEADANAWITAECAGMGLGVEGLHAMIDHAMADLPMGLGLHRVTVGIRPGHTVSERLATRVGFTRQPKLRSFLKVGGEWINHDVWIITSTLTHSGQDARS